MEILGVGPSELIFIVIIALIILGPKDMQKAGKAFGKWMNSVVTSDGWKVFQQTSQELKTLPNRLMRDANEELGQVGNELKSAASESSKNNLFIPLPSRLVGKSENKIISSTPTETKVNESDQKKDE